MNLNPLTEVVCVERKSNFMVILINIEIYGKLIK